MRMITLTTDFGLKDGNVGVMKGVIASINPQVEIVDLSHLIAAQNVFEGALVMGRSVNYFPENTIHIGVVDPGVGTQRRPIAARLGRQWFVGPDNGLCTLMWHHARQQGLPLAFYHLDRPEFWLPEISNVFHGRDIFSPVGAHLSLGVPFEKLGTRIEDPTLLDFPTPNRTQHGWLGEVIHVDHFGNLATNIMREQLKELGPVSVYCCGQDTGRLVRTFGDRQPGELVALVGSSGNLIISVVNGSAASLLDAQRGDPVEVLEISK